MKRIACIIGIPFLFIIATGTAGCTKDAAVADDQAMAARTPEASAPSHETLIVPAGTSFIAVLQTRLSTDVNNTGDPFVATTVEPIVVDGRTVVPAGSRIDGELRDVQGSGRIKNRARMTLVFEEIADAGGKTHPMSTLPLTIQAASGGKKNGAVIGAAAGAGAGTVLVLATKGDDVKLSQGLKLYVQMTGPTSFVVATR
jgi:hypothetical protein